MKHLCIYVSLIIIFLSVISCSSDNNEIPQKTLVESQMIRYKYIFGKLDSTGLLHERIVYDKNGRDSIIEIYDKDGLLFKTTILYYDSSGNNTKSLSYGSDGKVESKTEIKYSIRGEILEENKEGIDGSYNRKKLNYNDVGQIIKEQVSMRWYYDFINDWMTYNYTTLKIYDNGYCIGEKVSENGSTFKLKKTKFDSLGKIIYEDLGDNIRKYSYEKNGNIIEELSLDENAKLAWRWVSIYDSNNVLIEYHTYNAVNEPTELLKREFFYK